jgi:hypothetical protein
MDSSWNLKLISNRCREFGNVSLDLFGLEEEQDREMAPEVERERELERPPPATPAPHQLHKDLLSFVKTGNRNRLSHVYLPAF